MKLQTRFVYWFIFVVFIMSMTMFYFLFSTVKPVSLTIGNHIGFFLWSAIPSLFMLFAIIKQRWIGFLIILSGVLIASSSLIFEILQSSSEGSGTLSAVLSYILLMNIFILVALVVEGALLIFQMFKKKQ
jgi:hypothetical protein